MFRSIAVIFRETSYKFQVLLPGITQYKNIVIMLLNIYSLISVKSLHVFPCFKWRCTHFTALGVSRRLTLKPILVLFSDTKIIWKFLVKSYILFMHLSMFNYFCILFFLSIHMHWSEVMSVSYLDASFSVVGQVEGTFTLLTLDEYWIPFCCGLVSSKHWSITWVCVRLHILPDQWFFTQSVRLSVCGTSCMLKWLFHI
jgi:hypothetical protein